MIVNKILASKASMAIMRSTWRLVVATSKYLQSQCGGIGRHARFKIWFLREWRFESAHWYHFLIVKIRK